MLRICKTVVVRNFLQPRAVAATPAAGAKNKQTVEEKLGLPLKPKRPLTPYLRFLNKVRPVLVQKYPDAKVTEIAKLGGEQWAKAEVELKQELEKEFRKEFSVYVSELEQYKKSLSVEQKEQLEKAKDDAVVAKEKRNFRKKIKELGKPKRPCSAFMAYLLENKTRKENESYQELQVRIAKQWEEENESIKSKYIENFNKQREIYRNELQKWEEKMIRLGNIDVVRNEALIEPPFPRNPTNTKKTK